MENKKKLWAARIDEWQRSGNSQRQYCEDNRLALAAFTRWKKRLKEEVALRGAENFVEILVDRALSTQTENTGRVSIVIGAYTVTVSGTVDPRQLDSVLNVLEQR